MSTRDGGLSLLRRASRVGENAPRPDGTLKVRGEFAYSSDLYAEGMLWGATVRSTEVHARICSVDISGALATPGVHVVVTADDVPGSPYYGLDGDDQPVFASAVVRHLGEPIAAVAADHPEAARLAASRVVVEYEPLAPLLDPERALTAEPIHPNGNLFRHLPIRKGDPDATGDVVVEGSYATGMQDQAFLGPESGLAIPDSGGDGVELFISTQWLHVDRDQVAACLGLEPERVRLTLSGVGGAFGAREDISLQVHLCMLALRAGRPVKMVYNRAESFFGHVHRHPSRLWYRHHADRDGTLVKVEARLLLDGGAYLSSSFHVLGNAASFAVGPYRVPNVVIDSWNVRTNNPPCGAMRGFGVVQSCFGHEAQMDKLAAALGHDPVELRLRNALGHGDTCATGQRITGTLPMAEVIARTAALPLPPELTEHTPMLALPGGAGRCADRSRVVRGVGFAASYKNLMYAEGFDDFSTARCRIDHGVVTVHCACAEVGQGFVTLVCQIAREVLRIDDVVVAPADTVEVGSAGSTSASRQTWMSGGAVEAACIAARDRVISELALRSGVEVASLVLVDDRVVSGDGRVDTTMTEAAAGLVVDETREFHHAPTQPLDENGQGDAHVSFSGTAHRAVVDVDLDLGLVRVVQIATAQDVGRALNPLAVGGQIEGGVAQGVGLAVMEEIVVDGGRIRNASFTDYLIPTALDMPEVVWDLIEEPEPGAPFGAKGVGEPPVVSSTPAVVAAIRAATGLALDRVPVRPQDIVRGRASTAT
ncbi:MAG: xanthine dehydrogenase subunit D [Acidimicrobiia bacterium]|nr:xanthine dehydrogenase subunit D [Acidimicrobiia bacterium]